MNLRSILPDNTSQHQRFRKGCDKGTLFWTSSLVAANSNSIPAGNFSSLVFWLCHWRKICGIEPLSISECLNWNRTRGCAASVSSFHRLWYILATSTNTWQYRQPREACRRSSSSPTEGFRHTSRSQAWVWSRGILDASSNTSREYYKKQFFRGSAVLDA